jgi:hypothetical protein
LPVLRPRGTAFRRALDEALQQMQSLWNSSTRSCFILIDDGAVRHGPSMQEEFMFKVLYCCNRTIERHTN